MQKTCHLTCKSGLHGTEAILLYLGLSNLPQLLLSNLLDPCMAKGNKECLHESTNPNIRI